MARAARLHPALRAWANALHSTGASWSAYVLCALPPVSAALCWHVLVRAVDRMLDCSSGGLAVDLLEETTGTRIGVAVAITGLVYTVSLLASWHALDAMGAAAGLSPS